MDLRSDNLAGRLPDGREIRYDPSAPETVCECGRPLADHPPLGKVAPLRSWHYEHSAVSGSRPLELDTRRPSPSELAAAVRELES